MIHLFEELLFKLVDVLTIGAAGALRVQLDQRIRRALTLAEEGRVRFIIEYYFARRVKF